MEEKTEEKAPDGKQKPWFLVIFAAALAIGTSLVVFSEFQKKNGEEANDSSEIEQSVQRVAVGGDYRIYVSLVEFESTKDDASAWDMDKSGPDIAYEMSWRGNRIHKSTTADDTLVATYTGMKLGFQTALRLAKGGKLDPNDLFDAPVITIAPDGFINIQFFDRDLLDTDDEAANVRVPLADLQVGLNQFGADVVGKSVRRFELEVIDRKADPFKVLQEMNQRVNGPQ